MKLNIKVPEERIAKFPREKGKSLLMVVRREPFKIEHRIFYEIVDILTPDYLLVLNNSKVIKAKIKLKKPSGKLADFLFVSSDGNLVKGLMKGRVREGWILESKKGRRFEVLGRDDKGYVVLRSEENIFSVLEDEGEIPLPPYIKRESLPEDERYYQTVYAQKPGSIAAPTAGLHFTEEILKTLNEKGIKAVFVTLHVGPGTFKPVEDPDKHKMEEEYYEIPEQTLEEILKHKGKGGKILAVGTTSVRTLESWARTGKSLGYTDLFIKPPFEFKMVDALLTNFHLPHGTPILLVAAFMGWDKVKITYEEALKRDYMFFSYGDAMLIL
jgi:S-adenosylmethionine:tRNA ribosyltransferase-isomerase